jgi:hypothetical protein
MGLRNGATTPARSGDEASSPKDTTGGADLRIELMGADGTS